MKKLLLTTGLTALMLSACTFGGPVTEEFEYNATDKQGTVELIQEYFKDTLNNTNMVVTLKADGRVALTENLEGDKNVLFYTSTNVTSYTFVKDEKYYYAVDYGDGKYCMEDKSLYDNGRYAFRTFSLINATWPESGTYNCTYKGEGTLGEKEEDYRGTATFTLEMRDGDRSVNINATSENKLAKNYDITVANVENGEAVSVTYNISFVYGSASVTLPEDIETWPIS